jgi:4-amino-4-deoxy-L-arabinose transferase-like glycosyltransferase
MHAALSLLRSRWSLAALALALVLRIVLIAATHNWEPVSDPHDYVRHAVSIAHGHGMAPSLLPQGGPSALRPPAYPYFLGGVFALSGDSWTAGRIASALLGVIAVALMGLVALRLWGRTAALAAMVIAAIYAPFVLLSGTLVSEPLGLVFVLGLLALVLGFDDAPRPRWVAPVAGVLLALALLDRPAFVPFTLPLLASLWGRPWRSWAALREPLIALVVAGIVVLPWTIRNAHEFHAFVPISTQSGFLIGGTYNYTSDHDSFEPATYRPANFDPALRLITQDRSLDENEMNRKLSTAGKDYAKDHPGYVPRVMWLNGLRLLGIWHGGREVRNSYAFQGIDASYAKLARFSWYLLALLALAGIGMGALRGIAWWIWLVPVLLFVSVTAILGDVRYRAPIEPFVIWAAAYAAAGVIDRRRAQPPPPTPPPPR